MKKFITLSLLLLIVGCDKDSPTAGEEVPPTAGEEVHPLVGTWAITQIIQVNGDPYQSLTLEGVTTVTTIPDDANNQTFIYNTNGTYSFVAEINSEYSSGNGTWSTTDNYITLEPSPSAQSGYQLGLYYWNPALTTIQSYSVSGGILTMIFSNTTGVFTLGTIQTYQKQ